MGFSSGGQGHGSMFNEINITPLTDIFLVLLIIMMVIAPGFQNKQQEIKMPTLKAGKSIEAEGITVEILKNGSMFVQGKTVTSETLLSELQTAKETAKEKHVLVRADESTPSSEVMKVFEASSQAGYEKLTVAGEPLSQQRARELNTPTVEEQEATN